MSRQRRRGQPAVVYPQMPTTDNRGNATIVPNLDAPINVRAAFIPLRSQKAEVPGQQKIDVYRMILDPNLENVDLWSRVEWLGEEWDIIAPPAYHHGTRRHTRHWSIDIRQRP